MCMINNNHLPTFNKDFYIVKFIFKTINVSKQGTFLYLVLLQPLQKHKKSNCSLVLFKEFYIIRGSLYLIDVEK